MKSIAVYFDVCRVGHDDAFLGINAANVGDILDCELSISDRLFESDIGLMYDVGGFRKKCVKFGRRDIVYQLDNNVLFRPLTFPNGPGIIMIKCGTIIAATVTDHRWARIILRFISCRRELSPPSEVVFIPDLYPEETLKRVKEEFGLIRADLDKDTFGETIEFDESLGPKIRMAIERINTVGKIADSIEKLIVARPARWREQFEAMDPAELVVVRDAVLARADDAVKWFNELIGRAEQI